jgi:hypothetical protein
MSQLSFLTMLYIMAENGGRFSPWSWWWYNQKARALDMEIIEKCLVNEINLKSKKHLQNTPYKIRITKNINGYGVVVIRLWSEFCQ